MSKNKKVRVSIELFHNQSKDEYTLKIKTGDWYNVIKITKDEAEHTSRNHNVEIQKS